MPEAVERERSLNGPEKAAAVLLMLGAPTAARLLKHFDPPDLRVVARSAAGLGAVAPVTLERLAEEFAADFSAGVNLLGDMSQARDLLAEALPPGEVDELLGAPAVEEPDLWQALAAAPESAIIAFLLAEKPATATYLLSRLDPPLVARIVSALPRNRRNAALCGLVAPPEVSPLAAQLVEKPLRDLLESSKASTGVAEGRQRIAGIINDLDPEAAEDVIRAIGEARPKDAAAIKAMLFSFSDLPKLSERARALLFDRASIDIVVMALRGTDPEFRNAILSSMPSRGRRLVEGELASGAAAPPREVAKARKAIAEIVLGMAARNEIELGGVPDGAACGTEREK
jgi:flagellar motor switch protein FliG